jgi:hypothetical protein
MKHQVFKQREFLARQRNRFASAGHSALHAFQFEVALAQNEPRRPSPQQRAAARTKLGE